MASPAARWSVFDGVKSFPQTPEALMAEIDAAIAASELARPAAPDDASEKEPHEYKLAEESCKLEKLSENLELAPLGSIASSRHQELQQIVRRLPYPSHVQPQKEAKTKPNVAGVPSD